MISFRKSPQFDQEATVILCEENHLQTKKFNFSNVDLEKEIVSLQKLNHFEAKNGELFPLILNKKSFLLVGVGKNEKMSLTALRITVRAALLGSFLRKVKEVEIIPHSNDDTAIQAIIEGVLVGTYKWNKYISKEKDDKSVDNKSVFLVAEPKPIFKQAAAICEGVNLTRDLINDNADTITSDYLEKVILDLIKDKKNISVETLNRAELKKKGLNLHLAVNQGSKKEPKLIIVKYQGGSPTDDYVALVGKGMTFDTGGLNIKTTGHIETMKIDMSGAGAVIGVLKNVLALNIKKNILFTVGLAENAIGSEAYKPGDVYVGYAGKSVEIGNTDAEGRLVLADAISYLVKNYKPKKMIDLATLTGACVVALGFDYTGLFSNNDKFAEELLVSAKATDDRAWHLPLYPEIKDYIKSQIADLKNTSSIRGAGASTAAEFLNQFTEKTTWAHLDIAGSAFVDNKTRMYFGHGATGAGVRLVTHYLINH